MENKKGQTFKDFYFIGIRTMKLGDNTHVDYFLLSEYGESKEEDEIQTSAYDKAQKIVAKLSERDNVAYRLELVEMLSPAKYKVLKEYVNHYVDESLRVYDTSDELTTEEE